MSARLKAVLAVVLRPLQFVVYLFVGFVPRTRRQCMRQRPLVNDLDDVAVGPVCRTEHEPTSALAAVRDGGVGDYCSRYDEIRGRFHSYEPGGASRRTVEAIRAECLGDAS